MLLEVFLEGSNTDKFEVNFTLEYVLSAMIGVMSHWFKQDNPPPIKKLVELIYDLTKNGVVGRFPSEVHRRGYT